MIDPFREYEDAGYLATFFLSPEEFVEDDYDEVHEYFFDEEHLHECLQSGKLYLYVEFERSGYMILFKPVIRNENHLSIDDIPCVLEHIAKYKGDEREEYFQDLQRFLKFKQNGMPLVSFQKSLGSYSYDDPYLDDEEHIAHAQYQFVISLSVDRYFERDFADFLVGFNEINAKRGIKLEDRHYSREALTIFLLVAEGEFEGKNMPKDLLDYYHENILKAEELDDYDLIRSLAYNYYEGLHGFPQDFAKSEYYLCKAYVMRKNPDIANTLGYIYYYGRNSGGVPNKEKAFQYFAIAHFAGGYYEATYKLSDCYMKGYGTPVNDQAAFRLVDSIFEENREIFCKGINGKFADVCLRLASFYHNGGPVKPNIHVALTLAHYAQCAIKERLLEEPEYPGDRSVAVSIYHLVRKIESELPIQPRQISRGGYVVDPNLSFYFQNGFSIEIFPDGDGWMRIEVRITSYPYQAAFIDSIPFCERVQNVVFLAHLDLLDGEIERICKEKPDALTLSGAQAEFHFEDDESNDHTLDIYQLVYVPQTIDYLEKTFTLVSVAFSPNGKTYDYLYQGSVEPNVGDILCVDSNGVEKEVTVMKVEKLYEDQLPLPTKKMSIARSRHFA